jgi:hypothetical protein
MVVEQALAAPARVRLVASPKRGGVRWLAELDDATAAGYAACVLPLVPAVEAALSPSVVANRVAATSSDPPRIRLEAWRAARRRFVQLGVAHTAGADAVVMTDVVACYPSIGPETVGRTLRTLGERTTVVARVREVLLALGSAGVRGLPIGPEPSAVLANAVLSVADRGLAEGGFRHLRWVDDFLVFLDDRTDAPRALAVLAEALSTAGLRLAEHKTRVVVDPRRIGSVAHDRALSGRATTARLRCDADAVPGLARGDALVPGDRRVGARRRQARAAGGSG